jgi:thiaminase/transcriptional activator TenA
VAPFSDRLREAAEPDWTRATTHRFTRELADDVLDPAVFRRYLIEDYRFVDALASLVGFAVGHAPAMPQRARLAGFLSVLTGAEDAFFKRAFAAAGVAEATWRAATCGPVTQGFAGLFAEAASVGYDEILAALLPVEWVYLDWATREAGKRPRPHYQEWIALHDTPEFRDFVAWMRAEMDRLGPALPKARQDRLAALFRSAVALEVAFFDSAYGPG